MVRSGGDLAAPLTVNYWSDERYSNSARAGTGKDFVSDGINFAANQTMTIVNVFPLADSEVPTTATEKSAEAVIFELFDAPGYFAGAPNAKSRAMVTLFDNTATVTIAATDNTADEADDTAEFTVTRSGAQIGADLTVRYTIDPDTYRLEPDGSHTPNAATPGVDYTRDPLDTGSQSDWSGTVTIPTGQSSAIITIHGILGIDEEPEAILFQLAASPGLCHWWRGNCARNAGECAKQIAAIHAIII